jgi:pyridoxine kinase
LLPAKFSGAGDTLTAVFLFHVLAGVGVVAAARLAGASLAGLLRRTFEAGSGELLTVAARGEFLAPTGVVEAVLF